MNNNAKPNILIGVVGPCKSGKSTLKKNLALKNINIKHIAQEHSHSPTMWKALSNPDKLVFLEVSYPNTIKRGKLIWSESDYEIQVKRLNNAYTNADLIIDTNLYTAEQVSNKVIMFMESLKN